MPRFASRICIERSSILFISEHWRPRNLLSMIFDTACLASMHEPFIYTDPTAYKPLQRRCYLDLSELFSYTTKDKDKDKDQFSTAGEMVV